MMKTKNINLLDSDNDIFNIIGEYVKKDNKNRIDPTIWNEFDSNIDLDGIKEYINNSNKFNKINCHSFQIIYSVNNNISLTSFNIRMLDENNNKISCINSSCKVSYKYKDKDREDFLCNKECQNVINNINNNIKDFIKFIRMNKNIY